MSRLLHKYIGFKSFVVRESQARTGWLPLLWTRPHQNRSLKVFCHVMKLLAGNSSMNSKLTGEGAEEDEDVQKKSLTFSTINSDF